MVIFKLCFIFNGFLNHLHVVKYENEINPAQNIVTIFKSYRPKYGNLAGVHVFGIVCCLQDMWVSPSG